MQKSLKIKDLNRMTFIVKMEEAAIRAIAIYVLIIFNLGLPVWIWIFLFFSPDISILAYVMGSRTGASIYNLFHHRAIAVILASIGIFFQNDITIAIGVLLFAHSSFDRMMGYGLKFNDNFKHTSLGWIGSTLHSNK
jgi:hypothetical protein